MRRLLAAERHLAAADPTMAALIERLGPCTLRRRRGADPFASLIEAIVAQMISTKAAKTVYGRLLAALGEDAPTPEGVARAGEERLRAAGLSGAKARAMAELARRVTSGALPLDALARRDAGRIRAALIEVPGIGEWTVQMFLIFHLCRPDVFPARDLGILEGMRLAYALPARPSPAEAERHALPWAPYRSTASWYLWRTLDGPVALA